MGTDGKNLDRGRGQLRKNLRISYCVGKFLIMYVQMNSSEVNLFVFKMEN